MADQVQFRGGNTSQHSQFIGAPREITVDTDKKVAVVHDGSTAGGIPMLREDMANVPQSSLPVAIGGFLQKNSPLASSASGASDAITGSYTPAITALTNGMTLYVRAGSANATTTPSFTPNSGTIAAKTIVKGAGSALSVGDVSGAGHWLELTYDSTLDKWVLLNPATGINSFAFGQTWQNVKASRALATTYTNTTGRPICVQAWGTSTMNSNILGTVSGIVTAAQGCSVGGVTMGISFVVPPGASYSISISDGTPSLAYWNELR